MILGFIQNFTWTIAYDGRDYRKGGLIVVMFQQSNRSGKVHRELNPVKQGTMDSV